MVGVPGGNAFVAVVTGFAGFRDAHGAEFFGWLAIDPEFGWFDLELISGNRDESLDVVLGTVIFDKAGTLLDADDVLGGEDENLPAIRSAEVVSKFVYEDVIARVHDAAGENLPFSNEIAATLDGIAFLSIRGKAVFFSQTELEVTVGAESAWVVNELPHRRADLDGVAVFEVEFAMRPEEEIVFGDGVFPAEGAFVVGDDVEVGAPGEEGGEALDEGGIGRLVGVLGNDPVEGGLHGAGRDLEGLGDVAANPEGDDDGDEEDLDVVGEIRVAGFGQCLLAGFVDLFREGLDALAVLALDGVFQTGTHGRDLVQLGGREEITLVVDEAGDAFVEELRVFEVAGC